MNNSDQRIAQCVFILVGLTLATSVLGKRVELLQGDLSLDVPSELSPGSQQSEAPHDYDIIGYLRSADRRVSVKVTYGKHDLDPKNLSAFLQEKVVDYSRLQKKLPHFRWLNHSIVDRSGREWADISFAHGHMNTTKTEAYARCLSCIAHRHLLEIWVVTHRMPDPGEKALVDRIISSVRLRNA